MMVDYDVIVVGGGPAGSTAARRIAQEGLSVLLLEKSEFPRNKACAGAIRYAVTELLDFDLSPVIHRKISGFSIFAPAGYRIDCIPENRTMPGYTVMREEFDHLLLQKAAEAGADVRQNIEAIDIQEQSSHVTVSSINGNSHTCRYVIGADGINSIVAKQLGFYKRWTSSSASVAIEIEAEIGEKQVREICGEPSGYDADLFLLYFGEFPHGYTWCFPKKSILSLGACCRQDKVSNIRAGYTNWYKKFKEEYSIEPQILSDMSARFPVTQMNTIVKGRALLTGDTAGFVDAFTGEGISGAIQSGILASSAIKNAITESNPHLLRDYEKQCKKEIISELKVSQSLAGLFYKSMKNMETLCRFFRDDSYASYLIAAAIGGLLTQKEVKRKMTLRMMRTRPRDALSLYM